MRISKIPVIKRFQLKADPSGESYVEVRQASENDNIERNDLFSKTTRIYDDEIIGRVQLQTEYNTRKVNRRISYLTLASVTGITDDEGVEYFRTANTVDGPKVRAAMTESEFNYAWGKLTTELINEIVGYVLEVNPTWDFNRSGE